MPSIIIPRNVAEWAASIYAPFALTWEQAKPLPKIRGMRVLGRAAGDAALVDISCDLARQSIKQVSLVCPIGGDFVHLVTHTLAMLHKRASRADADQWYAQLLMSLPKDRPGRRLKAWGIWSVDVQTTAQGLLAILIRRRV